MLTGGLQPHKLSWLQLQIAENTLLCTYTTTDAAAFLKTLHPGAGINNAAASGVLLQKDSPKFSPEYVIV